MYKNPNYFTITGTLFNTETREVQGKKDPTQTYYFNSYILEVKEKRSYMKDGAERVYDKTHLLKFRLPYKFALESFSRGDQLEVTFAVTGRSYTSKGEEYFSVELEAMDIRYATVNSNQGWSNKGGVHYTPNTQAQSKPSESPQLQTQMGFDEARVAPEIDNVSDIQRTFTSSPYDNQGEEDLPF